MLFAFWIYYPVEDFTKSRGLGQQYEKVGESYLRSGELEKAKEAFGKAIRANFDPWDNQHWHWARCYLRLGKIHERLRNWPEAIEAYEKALSEIKLETYGSPDAKQAMVTHTEARLQILRQKMIEGLKNDVAP